MKECRAYNSLFLEYGARFEELCAEYEVVADELGAPKKQFAFSLESIEELEKEIQDMQKIIQRKEEQEYIRPLGRVTGLACYILGLRATATSHEFNTVFVTCAMRWLMTANAWVTCQYILY